MLLYEPPAMNWSLKDAASTSLTPASVLASTQAIIDEVVKTARPGDHVLVMSNGGFEGIHQRLLEALEQTRQQETI